MSAAYVNAFIEGKIMIGLVWCMNGESLHDISIYGAEESHGYETMRVSSQLDNPQVADRHLTYGIKGKEIAPLRQIAIGIAVGYLGELLTEENKTLIQGFFVSGHI